MANKEQVIEFLKDLSGTWFCELNNLNHIVKIDNALWWQQMYFCAGMNERPTARCKDEDFTKKKYFFVDIDIRKIIYDKEKRIIDDKELWDKWLEIIKKISDAWYWDYRYSVFSGNGIHLYYVWDEIQIDHKTYSLWVEKVYQILDNAIYPFCCDQACKNIARITRLPWSINTRIKKEKWVEIWNMWDIECDFFEYRDNTSQFMGQLKELAQQYEKELEIMKREEQIVRQIVGNIKKDDKIFEQINQIPAYELAEFVWWVRYKDCWKDNCPLLEEHKNMWAYYWKPSNVVVNTWSSLIKNKYEKYFTSYRLIRDEFMNWDVKATLDFFKDRYNIVVVEKWVIPPKKDYPIKWFVYWTAVFDPFDCAMSGELVTVVAKTNSWKTTFAMNMLQENKKIGKEWFYINLEFIIETVARTRRLSINNKKKRNLTDLEPLDEREQDLLDRYVKAYLSKFKYYNNPNWETIDDLIDIIVKKNNEWVELFVVDSFSKIKWNSDTEHTRGNQNTVMQKLQSLCQNLWIVIVLLHHTNKAGVFEWSQKIMDDSNVFIVMWREVSPMWNDITKFSLSKDKFVSYTDIQTMFDKWEYVPMF